MNYEVYTKYDESVYGQGLGEATEDDEYHSVSAETREEAAEEAKRQADYPVDYVISVTPE